MCMTLSIKKFKNLIKKNKNLLNILKIKIKKIKVRKIKKIKIRKIKIKYLIFLKYLKSLIKKVINDKKFKVFTVYFIIFSTKIILNKTHCAPYILIDNPDDVVEIAELAKKLIESNNIKRVFVNDHLNCCSAPEKFCKIGEYARDFVFQNSQIRHLERYSSDFSKIESDVNILQLKADLISTKEGVDRLTIDNLSDYENINPRMLFENLKAATLRIFLSKNDISFITDENKTVVERGQYGLFANVSRSPVRPCPPSKLFIEHITDYID